MYCTFTSTIVKVNPLASHFPRIWRSKSSNSDVPRHRRLKNAVSNTINHPSILCCRSRTVHEARYRQPIMSSAIVRRPGACRQLQQLTAAARTSFRQSNPASGSGRRGYASEQEKTFKGQLYDSTQHRLQRERKEQERFAGIRTAKKAAAGPSPWIIPAGMDISGKVNGRRTHL